MTRPLLDTVRELAFPRFTGTPGACRAAERMARFFEEAGLVVTREAFSVSRNAMSRYRTLLHGVAAACALFLGASAPGHPGAALAVGVALLALVAGAGRWPRWIERGFDAPPRVESENVVGRAPGRSGGGVTLVFLAHFDSKSARFPTFVPVALILAGALAVCALTLACAWSLTASSPLDAGWARALSALGAAAFLAPIANRSGNESPGAMDNASGCAVLRELAGALPADPALAGAALVFVSTGAEEIGLAGALRWIREHGPELDRARTLFVNVDSTGVGRGLLALDVRGRAPDGRPMSELVRCAAKAAGVPVRRLAFLPGVGVDTMPISARGYATVTVTGRVLGAASRRIHSPRDSVEHLSEAGLRDAAAFAAALAREAVRSAGASR
jgi:hypothetical protein